VYAGGGLYTVTLTVTDNGGATSSATTTASVTAGNQLPTANPGGPYSSTVGQVIQFNGTGSRDPDGSIQTYQWYFGDGATGTGPTPTHSYASPGTYRVFLDVTDAAATRSARIRRRPSRRADPHASDRYSLGRVGRP
jgi:PKD repeat protein